MTIATKEGLESFKMGSKLQQYQKCNKMFERKEWYYTTCENCFGAEKIERPRFWERETKF